MIHLCFGISQRQLSQILWNLEGIKYTYCKKFYIIFVAPKNVLKFKNLFKNFSVSFAGGWPEIPLSNPFNLTRNEYNTASNIKTVMTICSCCCQELEHEFLHKGILLTRERKWDWSKETGVEWVGKLAEPAHSTWSIYAISRDKIGAIRNGNNRVYLELDTGVGCGSVK